MLASSMQVESQRDDSDRLELAQLDRAVLWLDIQLVEFSEICDFDPQNDHSRHVNKPGKKR